MRVGIVGSGRIGGNAGRLFARAGHEVMFSFSRDEEKLRALAREAGNGARAGTPADAAAFADVLMLSVPWGVIDRALEAVGPLGGRILIDTTNPFGRGGPVELPGGVSAAEYNAGRARGARLVKSYNTLTAGFQAEAAGRADRAPMFYAGEDAGAKKVVAGLIADSGFEPVDVGGWGEVWIMEAPRRPGAVYGEEYPAEAARAIAAAVKRDPEEASRLARESKVDG